MTLKSIYISLNNSYVQVRKYDFNTCFKFFIGISVIFYLNIGLILLKIQKIILQKLNLSIWNEEKSKIWLSITRFLMNNNSETYFIRNFYVKCCVLKLNINLLSFLTNVKLFMVIKHSSIIIHYLYITH